MLGFLIYLPTLAYIPHYSYLLSLIYLLFKYRNDIPVKYKQITSSRKLNVKVNLLIVVLIILFSLLNRAFFIGNIDTIKDAFPYISLLLLTYIIGIKASKNDLKVLIFLIFFESLFVIAEYMYGVSTFFSGLKRRPKAYGVSLKVLLGCVTVMT